MGLLLKGIVTCDGKTSPHYDTHSCPTNSSVEVEVEIHMKPGYIEFKPDLPIGWFKLWNGFECKNCTEAREKERR